MLKSAIVVFAVLLGASVSATELATPTAEVAAASSVTLKVPAMK